MAKLKENLSKLLWIHSRYLLFDHFFIQNISFSNCLHSFPVQSLRNSIQRFISQCFKKLVNREFKQYFRNFASEKGNEYQWEHILISTSPFVALYQPFCVRIVRTHRTNKRKTLEYFYRPWLNFCLYILQFLLQWSSSASTKP